jgi:hypothetical protein
LGFSNGTAPPLEELDEGRPAHAEEVGGLLRGEQQALGSEECGLALAHDLNH